MQVNIEIMRAFVRLRQMLQANADLDRKLTALEKKYDVQFRVVFDAIRELMAPPKPKGRKPIGFEARERAWTSNSAPRTGFPTRFEITVCDVKALAS